MPPFYFFSMIHSQWLIPWHTACFSFPAFWNLWKFPLFASATASSSQRSQPKALPAHAQLTLQALLVFSPFKGLIRVSGAGGLFTGSATQARPDAPCSPSGATWRVCIRNVCSEIILLALCYLVVFFSAFLVWKFNCVYSLIILTHINIIYSQICILYLGYLSLLLLKNTFIIIFRVFSSILIYSSIVLY